MVQNIPVAVAYKNKGSNSNYNTNEIAEEETECNT